MRSRLAAPDPLAGAPAAHLLARAGGLADAVRERALTTGLLARLVAVALALLLAMPLFVLTGVDPLGAYTALWSGAFGGLPNLGQTLARVDILILLALGVSIAFRARIYNIGAEGQLYAGALGATALDVRVGGPSVLMVPAALAAAALCGAVWAGIAGYLRARFRVNVLISTLMLNYVAILLVGFMVDGPLAKPNATAQSKVIDPSQVMWPLVPGSPLSAGIVFALLAAGLVWFVLTRTTFGYELRVHGGNEVAARAAGISEFGMTMKVMLLSGALAGLAGGVLLVETVRYLIEDISSGFGYTAIAVALLGALRPAGVLVAALLFGALEIGATAMEYTAQVPATVANLIEGLMVVFFLAAPLLRGLWPPRRRGPRA
jgi:ABC-type uncharacterized transport system permease subunit